MLKALPGGLLTVASLSILVAAAGCSSRGTGRDSGGGTVDTGGGGLDAGADANADTRPPMTDTGTYDPFDPDGACGASVVPTERIPGSLLITFDRSGSMDDPPSGDSGPTKWQLATQGINSVLATVDDELGAGIVLFPSDNSCGVTSTPDVPVAPLATSRPLIMAALSGARPSGGNTPMYDALRASYDYLDTVSTRGQKGVILVSDGAEGCDRSGLDATAARAAEELRTKNYLTYVVGLTTENNQLSTLAHSGGTPRSDTCLPECTSDSCFEDSECSTGTCEPIGGGVFPGGIPTPGFCTCASDTDCPTGLTCETPIIPILPATCEGDANCCHYNASEGSFQAEFTAALEDIARRFLDSCVFDVPRGADPSTFDPALVNVGVTFEGEDRTVLRQSSDDSVDSWNYTTPEHDSLIIQGPICDRLLEGAADVEIVTGCPTILI